MDVSQLIALWVGIAAVIAGGFWRIGSILIRIATAVEAVPALVSGFQDHDRRLVRLEEKTP